MWIKNAGKILSLLVLGGLLFFQIANNRTPEPVALFSTDIPADTLHVGGHVPNVPVTRFGSIDTMPLASAELGPCNILYFFDPNCPACAIAAESWRGKSAESLPFPIAMVAMGGTDEEIREYLAKYEIEVPTYETVEKGFAPLNLAAIPVGVALESGTIRRLFVGGADASADTVGKYTNWCGGDQ